MYPRDGFHQLSLAVPVNAGDADDLSGSNLQIEPGDALSGTPDGQPLHAQEGGTRLDFLTLEVGVHVPPDHQAGQLLPGGVGDLEGGDRPTPAHHCDPVAQREDLIELVSDEDYAQP